MDETGPRIEAPSRIHVYRRLALAERLTGASISHLQPNESFTLANAHAEQEVRHDAIWRTG